MRLILEASTAHNAPIPPQTVLSKVEAPPPLPANAILVKVPTRAVSVRLCGRLVGQARVRELAALFDGAVDEEGEDDER